MMYRRPLAVFVVILALLGSLGGAPVVAGSISTPADQAAPPVGGESPTGSVIDDSSVVPASKSDPTTLDSLSDGHAGVLSDIEGSAGTNETDSSDSENESDSADSDDNETNETDETNEFADEPLGQINGIRYDDSIEVDQSDGLSDEELEDYISRSMARVEYFRELKFKRMVDVEVISRDEYRERLQTRESEGDIDDFGQWNNLVWQTLFIVGSDTNISDAYDAVRGESVAGFYDSRTGNVTIVADSSDDLVIDNATLIHELTHALQDQHFNLSEDRFVGETQDEQLATLGLIEGDADYVAMQYEEHCEVRWECVQSPSDSGSSGTSNGFNYGVWALLFQPYSDGPAYVHELVEAEGWEAVDRLYESPPDATREIIHRERFDPRPLEFEDTSNRTWETFPDQGVNGTDTVGEASIFVMFWYQSYIHDDTELYNLHPGFLNEPHPYSVHNYDGSQSNGWTNDVMVPYRSTDGEYGSVWVTTWENEDEAEAFRRAYLILLATNDGEQYDLATWRVSADGFEGVYRIVRDGSTVTVVFAPSVDDLDTIRPGLEVPEEPPRLDFDPLEPPGRVDGTDSFPSDFNDSERNETAVENTRVSAAVALVALLLVGTIVAMTRRRR